MEEKNPYEFFTKYLAKFPPEILENAIRRFSEGFSEGFLEGIKKGKGAIIEVGSGNGAFSALFEMVTGIKPICIDPHNDPDSAYLSLKCPFGIMPRYSYVRDAIRELGDLDEVHLILIAPEPDDSRYDFEAIRDLRPKQVLILYENTGSAGSMSLISFLYEIGVFTYEELSEYVKYQKGISNEIKDTYKLQYLHRNDAGAFVYDLCIISSRYEGEPEINKQLIAPEIDQCCIS